MDKQNFQLLIRKTLCVALSLALLNLPMPAKDPALNGVPDIQLDELSFQKVMSVKIGDLVSGLSPEDPDYFCKRAALLVAQASVDKDGYRAIVMDLLKQTAKGVELGGIMGGQPTVARVARVAGELVAALDQDDPAAAAGKIVITESTSAVNDLAATKVENDTVKDLMKNVSEAARDQLIEKLFPGKTKPRVTRPYKVGSCDTNVTYEFQWPVPADHQVAGLRIFISGDCHCAKPLVLSKLPF